MSDLLRNVIAANRSGQRAALPSVCSAHPDVLRAALMLAEELNQPLIVEATSNQVNQHGGYTGMRPGDFISFVGGIADQVGCRRDRILFGGDHLGPQAWRNQPPEAAMAEARTLVAEYARAGFTKIHLDCAEGCAGEPDHPGDDVVAARAAELAEIADDAAADPAALSFMVGTEVPPPGGAREMEETVRPTTPEAARATMEKHVAAFGPQASRIAGLVVQPGVEFSAWGVDHLPPGGNAPLRAVLDGFDGLCFEAHSTDYQHDHAFGELASMGFAVLKVGPALTFAYRQALYGLDLLADLTGDANRQAPSVRSATEAAMLASPGYWQGHYPGNVREQFRLRHFSYSDRIRYYWGAPGIRAAVAALMEQMGALSLQRPELLQVFAPDVIDAAARMTAANSSADALILAQIQAALRPYFVGAKA